MSAPVNAAREAKCPRCSKPVKLLNSGKMPMHGPPGNRCRGSLKSPADVLAELEEET